jgi:hydrogenase small subunit
MPTRQELAQHVEAGDVVDILWLTAGLSCDGDTIALTAATQPSIEELVLGAIPFVPKVRLHNPVLSFENGDEFVRLFHDAAAGKMGRFIDSLAPQAWAVVAAGTCAAYGGIHAMQGNPTGCMGLPDYLGWTWKSNAGIPDRVSSRLPGSTR